MGVRPEPDPALARQDHLDDVRGELGELAVHRLVHAPTDGRRGLVLLRPQGRHDVGGGFRDEVRAGRVDQRGDLVLHAFGHDGVEAADVRHRLVDRLAGLHRHHVGRDLRDQVGEGVADLAGAYGLAGGRLGRLADPVGESVGGVTDELGAYGGRLLGRLGGGLRDHRLGEPAALGLQRPADRRADLVGRLADHRRRGVVGRALQCLGHPRVHRRDQLGAYVRRVRCGGAYGPVGQLGQHPVGGVRDHGRKIRVDRRAYGGDRIGVCLGRVRRRGLDRRRRHRRQQQLGVPPDHVGQPHLHLARHLQQDVAVGQRMARHLRRYLRDFRPLAIPHGPSPPGDNCFPVI